MGAGTTTGIEYAKGHGTENDFVILPDPDAVLELRPDRVAALCDRRTGVGADGVLRVAKAGALRRVGVLSVADTDDGWFMDYRNADGSVAEMCGNGLRVFAHYLAASGLDDEVLVGQGFEVGTRAGARAVTVEEIDGPIADVTVGMGAVAELGPAKADVAGRVYPGLGIDVGNPHVACIDVDLDEVTLAALDLSVAPGYDPDMFPAGVNVEFATALRDGAVTMRVHERGVGETRSCGTGTVAVAAAALRYAGCGGGLDGTVAVRVPGGRVEVRLSNGTATLRGPSVIVSSGHIDARWWSGVTEKSDASRGRCMES